MLEPPESPRSIGTLNRTANWKNPWGLANQQETVSP